MHITYEDQQKINKFARLNAKMEDLKHEIELKEVGASFYGNHVSNLIHACVFHLQNKLQNIKDACDELELADDSDGKIPYLFGEIFIYQDLESTQVCCMSYQL